MADIIREAPIGQLIRLVSGNRLFQYPEERDGFVLPPQYTAQLRTGTQDRAPPTDKESGDNSTLSRSFDSQDARTNEDVVERLESSGMSRTQSRHYSVAYTGERLAIEQQLAIERTKSVPVIPKTTTDGIVLVDWYTTDDPANPQNWSPGKRGFVTFLICLYTWVVYTGSSIYAPSEEQVMASFGISATAAALPLALYVLAYGIGPLIFGPLSEIPVVGRNPVYVVTFLLFFGLSFPTAVVNDFAGLLVLRFLQGFFGSPALANGGASFSDMYSLLYVPYQLSWWVWAAWGGPSVGFLMAGYAVMAEDWHWSLWEIVWMAAPLMVLLLLFLPETSTPNILLRRARRLRKLTGNERLRSQSEIDQGNLKASSILIDALIKPVEITIKDPSILFVNLYTALFYSTYYTFFEVFPLVFPPMYGFNLGEIGLAFMACQVGATIALAIYFAYLRWYMIPDNLAHGLRAQEHRLVPALFGSFCVPAGLFIFAWTARSDVHWIVPLIGVVVFVIGTFMILQSIFVYVPLSYPRYAASLFSGNDFVRSSAACASILYARPLFIGLGIAPGVSLLAGISVGGVLGMFLLYFYGAKLRARSTFASS